MGNLAAFVKEALTEILLLSAGFLLFMANPTSARRLEKTRTSGKLSKDKLDQEEQSVVMSDSISSVAMQLCLSELLHCPVCLELMGQGSASGLSSFVWQCVNGHPTCASCRAKMTRCPMCRAAFGADGIRCLAIEKLLSVVRLPCAFATHGCPETKGLLPQEKLKHELICPGRDVECLGKLMTSRFETCPWKGQPGEAVQHILRQHTSHVDREGFFNRRQYRFQEHELGLLCRLDLRGDLNSGWTYLYRLFVKNFPPIDLVLRLDSKLDGKLNGQPSSEEKTIERPDASFRESKGAPSGPESKEPITDTRHEKNEIAKGPARSMGGFLITCALPKGIEALYFNLQFSFQRTVCGAQQAKREIEYDDASIHITGEALSLYNFPSYTVRLLPKEKPHLVLPIENGTLSVSGVFHVTRTKVV